MEKVQQLNFFTFLPPGDYVTLQHDSYSGRNYSVNIFKQVRIEAVYWSNNGKWLTISEL